MVGLETLGYGFRFAAWPVVWAGTAVVALLPLSAIAKRLWRRVRPETAAALGLHNYSFPSGHAYGSTLIIGLLVVLAALAGGVWWALAGFLVALIISVGISRVYLGAHYPSDVVAGWLLGLVVLGLVVIGTGL
jgi:undecaprenyl-diphosphatase